MKLIRLLITVFIFCILSMPSYAKENTKFEPQDLFSPLEIWQVEIPEENLGSLKLTISFLGSKFYDDDIANKRFTNIENNAVMLSGIASISMVGNNKIPKDCPHPRVRIFPIEGMKDSHGRLVFWSTTSRPFFDGSINHFNSSTSIEINNFKGDQADVTLSSMNFTYADNKFSSSRIGPLKIRRIK